MTFQPLNLSLGKRYNYKGKPIKTCLKPTGKKQHLSPSTIANINVERLWFAKKQLEKSYLERKTGHCTQLKHQRLELSIDEAEHDVYFVLGLRKMATKSAQRKHWILSRIFKMTSRSQTMRP